MPVNIRKAGNVVNIDLGVNDVNSYELAAVANSFSFNSTTSVVKSRFFKNWGLEVPLNQLIIDGVVPANEAAFNAALATLSTVTTSGGGGGTPGGAVNSIQYNNAGAFGGIGFGNAGEVLTSNGNGIAASFKPAAGGAPIIPSTEIAFGNGVDPYTSTPDFVYSTDFGGAFNVGFSGTPVLQVAINSTIIGTGASAIAMGGNTIDLGDPFSAGNSTYLELGDLNRILLYKQGGNLYLKRDIANGIYADGDLSAGLNSTTRTIDDVAKTITDVSDESWLYKNVAGATFFSTTVATGTETGFWGNPGGNATSITWNDGAKKISLTSATGTLLDLDGTTFISQLVASDGTASTTAYLKADLLGTGVEFNINAYDGGTGQVTIAGNAITNILELIAASTGISIDGSAAQTIALTAANGVGINGSPISVAALDIQSTTAALRVPIQTTAQRTAITTTNIPGLIVFDTDLNGLFYTNNSGNWVQA